MGNGPAHEIYGPGLNDYRFAASKIRVEKSCKEEIGRVVSVVRANEDNPMHWIVKVDVDGRQKWLAAVPEASNAYAKVDEREKAKRFNSEDAASTTACFRGCRHWKLERVD
jgi:hypothetical protein